MPPSKKVFVGSSLVLMAVLLQVIMGLIANRLIGTIASSVESAGTMENMDAALDGAHRQSIILFAGFGVVWFLIVLGVILFVVGTYQNCKATEVLLAKLQGQK